MALGQVPDWVETKVRGHSWTSSTSVPWSSSTRGSCAWTGISWTGWFYIEQVLPRIFVFDLQSCEEFVKLPTSIGELYAPEAREAIRWLHDDASHSTPLRMPSWTSLRWA